MKIAIGVPVMYNFEGFTKLMRSIQGTEITVYVQNNWDENIGVASAWNLFLDQAINDNIDLLFIVNDDVTFEEGSFWNAVRAWETRPDDCILITGHTSISEPVFHEGMADFCCFALNPTQAMKEIGKFDDVNFYPAYFEDNDYLYRIKLSEFNYFMYGGLKVHHEGSKTQFWNGTGDEERTVSHDQFRTNRSYYKQKWGGEPGYETFLTPFNE